MHVAVAFPCIRGPSWGVLRNEKHLVGAKARVSLGHSRTGTYGLWMSL